MRAPDSLATRLFCGKLNDEAQGIQETQNNVVSLPFDVLLKTSNNIRTFVLA